METETKKCRKCGQEKPVTEFSKCKSSPDGLQYYCKGCYRQRYQENKPLIYSHEREGSPPFSHPDFDGKTRREVMDVMIAAKRWLEARGCEIQLSGTYTKVEVKQLKF